MIVRWSEDYIVHIYKITQCWFIYDFHIIYDLGDGNFAFANTCFNPNFRLENCEELLESRDPKLTPEFTFSFRIDPGDIRFKSTEILVEADTFELLKEAQNFCVNYYNEFQTTCLNS